MSVLREVDVEAALSLPIWRIPPRVFSRAERIVRDVRLNGRKALLQHALRLGDIKRGEKLIIRRPELKQSLQSITKQDRALLLRTAGRIRRFAKAQRGILKNIELKTEGVHAGHLVQPLERVGCYVPGGRYPLISSVLMTVVTARVAGVDDVWVASPRPCRLVRAAAGLAGAKGILAVGGAQAVAGLAYGFEGFSPVDLVAGPGNAWVTAAKKLVSGDVGIDFLAGPTEVLIVADETAKPDFVAADLIAQAEHDPVARPMLIVLNSKMIVAINREIESQLNALPSANRNVALKAFRNGFVVRARSIIEASKISNFIAPEHLQLALHNPRRVLSTFKHYGAVFLGHESAEVLGDYGAGPNHVLPTNRVARFSAGLSILSFVRLQTFLSCSSKMNSRQLVDDSACLARLEGLEGHARAALLRKAK